MKQLQAEGKLPLSSSAIEQRVKENEQKELAAKTTAQVAASGNQVTVLTTSQFAFKHFGPSAPIWARIPEKPRKPLEPELTVVEPVTGWRRWSIEMFGNELRSNNSVRWTPYEKLTAECKATSSISDPYGQHNCKGIHCTCGIYAYKTPEDAKFGENAPANLSSGRVHVWGEVYLWGRVVEHSKGWRGQFAYPKSFVDSGIARQVAAVYGCKVIQDTWEKPKPLQFMEDAARTAAEIFVKNHPEYFVCPENSQKMLDCMQKFGLRPDSVQSYQDVFDYLTAQRELQQGQMQKFQWTPGGIHPYGSII